MPLARIETEIRESEYTGAYANQTVNFAGLECLVELRTEDAATGIQFRECLIDYTRCPNQSCIKKLV